MSRAVALAVCVATLPVAALAGDLGLPAADAPVVAPAPVAQPDLVFTLRGGAAVAPDYFGSDDYAVGPDFAFSLDHLRLGGFSIGSPDPHFEATGFAPRGSFRYIGERSASDSPELSGLNDVDASLEIGLGLGYNQRHYRAFADARYGVIGHESWVGELGADLILYPTDRSTLWVGPRVQIGSERYTATYFGVTAAEAGASGLPAFAPDGGVVSAGLELGMTYEINDRWGVEWAVTYDRLMGDAADSPITGLGSEDQFGARIGLTRRFSLDF